MAFTAVENTQVIFHKMSAYFLQIPLVYGDRQEGEKAVCSVDCSKALTDFGWKAERTLQQTCGLNLYVMHFFLLFTKILLFSTSSHTVFKSCASKTPPHEDQSTIKTTYVWFQCKYVLLSRSCVYLDHYLSVEVMV